MTRAELLSLPKHRFHAGHKFKLTCGIECGLITVAEAAKLYDASLDDLALWRRLCVDALKQTVLINAARSEKPPHPKGWIVGRRRYSKRRAA